MTEFETKAEAKISARMELGAQLKKAREELGLFHDEIAAVIRIRSALLKALEEGDYNQFSSVVYIKGFIKTYAQYLKLPYEPLLLLYEQEPHEKKSKQVFEVSESRNIKKGPGGKIIVASSMCLVLIVILNMDWQKSESLEVDLYELPQAIQSEFVEAIDLEINQDTPDEKLNLDLNDKPQVISVNQDNETKMDMASFGDVTQFLIPLPRTHNPILKPNKITLIPEAEGWVELYEGETLLLRAKLMPTQSYLMSDTGATTLLLKGGDWAKAYKSDGMLKTQKAPSCNDYFCEMIQD